MPGHSQLATALANLCWERPFPLLGRARPVTCIPQDLVSAPVPVPHQAVGTPGREETAGGPACFGHPFPMQDLLSVMIL